MIKFTLTIWVCSFLGQYDCAPPIQSTTLYNSWYECSRAAHQQSIKVLSKLGYKEVNDAEVGTRYMCKEIDSI